MDVRATGEGAGRTLAFGDDLRAQLAANLDAHERWAVPVDERRRAAVAVVVVDSDAERHGDDLPAPSPGPRDHVPGPDLVEPPEAVPAGGPAVLLTKRAPKLRAHGGQWALPGGRIDEGEAPLDAARRELREELGLDLADTTLLGTLDDYPTRSGFVITPFVFWGGADPELTADPAEVLSVHRIGFGELCRPDSPRFITIPESERPVVQLPIRGRFIHAPTGAVLLQFRRVAIEGTSERVAGYEQPVFAWR